jgi:hypothetical protein
MLRMPWIVVAIGLFVASTLWVSGGSAARAEADPSTTPGAPLPVPAPVLPPLKVARIYTGDEEGYPARVFYAVDPAVYLYAFLAPSGRRASGSADEARSFWVSIRDHRGREVARLGGRLPPTLDLAHADLPRGCIDDPPNGLRIGQGALPPGRYRAQAFLDGLAAGEASFEIRPLQGPGEVRVSSAAVEDAEGTRRFTFTSRDRGVYAHVTLVNATRKQSHAHLVQVAFVGPEGRAGRLLGGVLRVPAGALLDGRDFPFACDVEHHDGLLVAGTPIATEVGPWTMRVLIDGKTVREVPFRIVKESSPARSTGS